MTAHVKDRKPRRAARQASTGGEAELQEAHAVLDALSAGRRGQPVAERIRELVRCALGDRAAAVLELEPPKTLARGWQELSGHGAECPCNCCRAARRLR